MGDANQSNSGIFHLQSTQNPPSGPPEVRANQTLLAVTQYEWLNEEGVSAKIVSRPESVTVTDIQSCWPQLRIKFSTSTKPAVLIVGLFTELDMDGFPELDSEIHIDVFDSPHSSVDFNQDSISVLVDEVTPVKYAVIRAAFIHFTPESLKGQISTASWVMRFAD